MQSIVHNLYVIFIKFYVYEEHMIYQRLLNTNYHRILIISLISTELFYFKAIIHFWSLNLSVKYFMSIAEF